MINCKADLMNTHVDNVDGELKRAFIESCNKHGVTLAINVPCDSAKYLEAFSYGMCYTNRPEVGRKLTLLDFIVQKDTNELSLQDSIMKFCPMTGDNKCYPTHSVQWRDFHGEAAWIFNPWTGKIRVAYDIASDLYGVAIVK